MKYTQKYTKQPSITRTHSVLPLLDHELLGLKEEAQQKQKICKKRKKKKYFEKIFKRFGEAFLSFSFNKL